MVATQATGPATAETSVPPPRLNLSGPQKAALLILGLDEAIATEILRHMEPADLRKLAKEVDAIDLPPPEALDPIYTEFLRRMREPVLARGGGDYVRRLTVAAIGEERARNVLTEAPGPPRPVDTIRQAKTATLAEILLDEHPQIAAVILTQLPREQASKVLLALPPERQSDLVGRLSSLEELPAKALDAANDVLARALSTSGAVAETGGRQTFDGVAFTAGVLNDMVPAESARLLAALDADPRKLATKLREAMFTFEDLGRLDKRAVQQLMREVPNDALLLALKQASESLREHFLSAVSSRAADQLRGDLSAMPPTRLSAVEKAQREIVDIATRLAADGRIALPVSGAEKLV